MLIWNKCIIVLLFYCSYRTPKRKYKRKVNICIDCIRVLHYPTNAKCILIKRYREGLLSRSQIFQILFSINICFLLERTVKYLSNSLFPKGQTRDVYKIPSHNKIHWKWWCHFYNAAQITVGLIVHNLNRSCKGP